MTDFTRHANKIRVTIDKQLLVFSANNQAKMFSRFVQQAGATLRKGDRIGKVTRSVDMTDFMSADEMSVYAHDVWTHVKRITEEKKQEATNARAA